MTATLKLKENEVPVGSRVHIYAPGAEEPDAVDGAPVVFRRLHGGIPQRAKMYLLRDGMETGGYEGLSIEGVEGEPKFSPVESYAPADAPVGRRYSVFEEDGTRVKVGKSQEDCWPLIVTKGEDGTVYVYQFPLEQHQLAGNPSFAPEVRMVGEIEDGRLLDALPYPRGLAHFMLTDEMAREAIIEALARKYRNSNSNQRLIHVLQEKGLEHYLHDVQLPEGAVLVPLD